MTSYPRPLDDRWAATLGDLQSRLRTVESRTMILDSTSPVAALPAVIDPAYSSGDPKVSINGAALTGPYQHLASYTPAANDAVVVLPIVTAAAGATYFVLGKLA